MRAEKKQIMVEGHPFLYVLHEYHDSVRWRVYSATDKTTYYDMYFTWKDFWAVNFHKPSIAAKLTHYAIKNGWRYQEEKQVEEIREASFLMGKLGLE
jgi:hypothetical protein